MRHDDHSRTDHLPDDEMLRYVDGHMTGEERARADGHIARCVSCAGREAVFARMSTTRLVDGERERARHAEGRARLRARLALEAESAGAAWLPPSSPARWGAAAAVAGVALATALLLPLRPPGAREELAAVEADARPVAALTPGLALNVQVHELCSRASHPVPEVSADVRQGVLRNYRMETVPPEQYELDYLITPDLGGAPDARNLWPQRYRARVWNAGVKDQLEDLLPRLVCRGRLDLLTAQREIATDWVAAYRKYFRTTAPLASPGRTKNTPNAPLSGRERIRLTTIVGWYAGNPT